MRLHDAINPEPVRVAFGMRRSGGGPISVVADADSVSLQSGQSVASIAAATQSAAGVLSATDKSKLDGLSGSAPQFTSRAALLGTNVPADVPLLRTGGFAAPGDGGDGLYLRVPTAPAHAAKFSTADGSWWELVPESGGVGVRQLGAVGDGAADDGQAIRDADALGRGIRFRRGVYRIAADLTISGLCEFREGAVLKLDAGVNVHLSAGYIAEDWNHCFDVSASGSSVTGDQAPKGYVTPQHWGALADGANDDMAAIEAADTYATIRPLSNTFAAGLPVKFPQPAAGDYYRTLTRPIYKSRGSLWFSDVPIYLREYGGVEIRGADGLDAVLVLIATGGNLINGKLYGAHYSTIRRLAFLPESGATVRQGVVHNCPAYFEECRATGFSEACYHAHAQSSGDRAFICAHPGANNDGTGTTIAYDGQGACPGSANGSEYTRCFASNGAASGTRGGAHGFVTHGNIAGIVKYNACDAHGCEGTGFLENTSVGSEYLENHSAQNSWKVVGRDPATVMTTLAAGVAATDTTADLTDASAIAVNDYLAIELDDGSSWIGRVTAKAVNTVTLDTPAPSPATAGNSVFDTTGYLPIKYHVSTAADEPGVGANWRTYWMANTGSVFDDTWAAGATFHPAGGVNVCDASSRTTIVGHYTEGGIESGVIGRNRTVVVGGWGAERTLFHNEFDGCTVINTGGAGPSPVGFRGKTDPGDDATAYGGGWGTVGGYAGGRIAEFGDWRDDPASTTAAMQFQWNAIRGRYEWMDDSSNRATHGVTGTGYTGLGYGALTQAHFWANGLLLANGSAVATNVSLIRTATNLAAIAGSTGETAVRGMIWLYTSPTAGGKIGAVCTQGGLIGVDAVLKEFGTIDP